LPVEWRPVLARAHLRILAYNSAYRSRQVLELPRSHVTFPTADPKATI